MSVEQKLMMKLRNCLCLECTRLTLSLSRWLMHSTTYLFLSIILSRISRSLFFMFDFSPWTMCTPLSNISSKSPLEMYPLSANFFPKRFFDSTLHTRLSLFDVGHCKVEGQDFAPVVAEVMQFEAVSPSHHSLSSAATPANTLLAYLRRFSHTGIIVLSTNVVPLQRSKEQSPMNT